MSILSALPRISPKTFYPSLGHRPYWQYTIGGYSGTESWNCKVLVVTDAVTEPTVITTTRKASIRPSNFEVVAIPSHEALTYELAMAIVNLGGSACATVRQLTHSGSLIVPGAEAAMVESNGNVVWKQGYLHDALHAVPRAATSAPAPAAEQLDLASDLVAAAGLV
jgi:hypothetical protein